VPFAESLKEAKRVLKPDGHLAIISYAVPRITNNTEAALEFNRYYFDRLGSNKAPGAPGCLWYCDRRRVDSGYAGEDFESVFSRVERFTFVEKMPNTSVGSFLGYLKTQSAYQSALEVFEDPLASLKEVLGDDLEKPLDAEISFHMVLCGDQ